MRYMLDTNVCIHIMKHKPESVLQTFRQHPIGDVCVSSITYAELCYGVSKGARREQNQLALSVFLSGLQILPFDASAALQFGRLRTSLETAGLPIGVTPNWFSENHLSVAARPPFSHAARVRAVELNQTHPPARASTMTTPASFFMRLA